MALYNLHTHIATLVCLYWVAGDYFGKNIIYRRLGKFVHLLHSEVALSVVHKLSTRSIPTELSTGIG